MKTIFAATTALLLAGTASQAAFTAYSSRAAFEGNLAALAIEPYATDNAIPLGSTVYNTITYTQTGTADGHSITGGSFSADEWVTHSLDITMPNPIYGLGADFSGATSSSGIFWNILGTNLSLRDTVPSGTGFWGVISDTPFTFIDVNGGPNPNELYTFDNLTWGVAVPEPTTLAALGTFALIGLRRRAK
ncbi:MAG TPA: PEP-CTERM sorting domain-containing protein [Tepidisphaeraceae bacterium]|nr:PEP-CTERM sorting domain-containing protein [Tepidisphaeraceae bacterium]